MMNIRALLIIIGLYVFVLTNAQNDKIPNKIDSLGLKQGFWIELEAKPTIVGITHIDLEEGRSEECMKYDFKNYIVLMYKGFYKNGLREGEWNVYTQEGNICYTITYDYGIIKGNFKLYHSNGHVLQGYIDRKSLTNVSYYDKNGGFIKKTDWFTSGLIERLNR